MDLSNMLNGPSRPKENHLRPTMMGNDKTVTSKKGEREKRSKRVTLTQMII